LKKTNVDNADLKTELKNHLAKNKK